MAPVGPRTVDRSHSGPNAPAARLGGQQFYWLSTYTVRKTKTAKKSSASSRPVKRISVSAVSSQFPASGSTASRPSVAT